MNFRPTALAALLVGAALALPAAPLRIADATVSGVEPLRQLALRFSFGNDVDTSVDHYSESAKARKLFEEKKYDILVVESADVPSELPAGCQVRPFAAEGFAVYVNAKNPVQKATVALVAEALMAGHPIWESFPGGSDHDLHRMTLRKGASGSQLGVRLLKKERFNVSILRVGSMRELLLLAGADPESFAAGRYHPEHPVEVRPLAVNGVMPTPRTLRDGSYPLTLRYAFVIRRGSAEAEKFAAALQSAEFRLVLVNNGLIPLQKEDKL